MPEHKSFHFDLFCQFFYLNTSDDEPVPLLCTNYHFDPGGALWFLMSFVGFFGVAHNISSCWQFFLIFFYSSWAMCRMMISVPFAFDSFESRSWKHFCSPVFCPEHAFFAPHQSCHKPVPFFTLSTPKCLPLLWSLTASARTVAEM